MLVIGIDAGGTATRAVLATADGACVGFGVGGSGNPTSSGIPTAITGVRSAVATALGQAGAALADVAGMVVAMAGHDARGGVSDWILDPLREEGFRGTLAHESDLLAMFSSGSVAPLGYGVVCGTGASAVRVEDGRITATADGLGWLLGDRGSGFWIGREAAVAVAGELDGVGPATALTPRVLEALGGTAADARTPGREGRAVGLDRLVRAVYGQRPVQLAGLAPLVFAAAEAQDPVAERILHDAGEAIVRTLALVEERPGPLVVGGSIVSRDGAPQRRLRAHLAETFGEQPFVVVDSGAAGAAVLALRHAGIVVDEAMRVRLRDEISRAAQPTPPRIVSL